MSDHQILFPPPANSEMSVHESLVFGPHATRHAITQMPLEMGSGSLPPDLQALLVHCPEIERTRGRQAADALRAKLAAAQRQ